MEFSLILRSSISSIGSTRSKSTERPLRVRFADAHLILDRVGRLGLIAKASVNRGADHGIRSPQDPLGSFVHRPTVSFAGLSENAYRTSISSSAALRKGKAA